MASAGFDAAEVSGLSSDDAQIVADEAEMTPADAARFVEHRAAAADPVAATVGGDQEDEAAEAARVIRSAGVPARALVSIVSLSGAADALVRLRAVNSVWRKFVDDPTAEGAPGGPRWLAASKRSPKHERARRCWCSF